MDTGAIKIGSGAVLSFVFLLIGVFCWLKADIFMRIR